MGLLKILQNLLETLEQEGFLIKLELEACIFINKVNPDECLRVIFAKHFRIPFLKEPLRRTTFGKLCSHKFATF